MELKIYLPQTVHLPDEDVPALVRRVAETLGPEAERFPASRGQLVRQAVLDGQIDDLKNYICSDGSVDLICDPSGEIPLVFEQPRQQSASKASDADILAKGRKETEEERKDSERVSRPLSVAGLLRLFFPSSEANSGTIPIKRRGEEDRK